MKSPKSSFIARLGAIAGALMLPPVLPAENPVIEWNQIGVTAALNGNQTISPASNTAGGTGLYLAYMHLAMYNAVNAINHRYQFYGSELSAPAGASPDAAAVAAAYYTLKNYFPDQEASLTFQYQVSLSLIPDGAAKDTGIQVGESAASAMISLRSDDGRGAE